MKIIPLTWAVMLSYIPLSFGGSVGPATTPEAYHFTPFVGAEAAYAWNNIEGVTFNNFKSQNSTEHWGGRLSAGVIRPIYESVNIIGEIGLGYYGKFDVNLPRISQQVSAELEGIDFLVGGLYRYNKFGLFLKGGAMQQTSLMTSTSDSSLTVPGVPPISISKNSSSTSQLAPEIKVGGLYNITEHLGATVSYMYVWGINPHQTKNVTLVNNLPIVTTDVNNQFSTLNLLMFGLQYEWA